MYLEELKLKQGFAQKRVQTKVGGQSGQISWTIPHAKFRLLETYKHMKYKHVYLGVNWRCPLIATKKKKKIWGVALAQPTSGH